MICTLSLGAGGATALPGSKRFDIDERDRSVGAAHSDRGHDGVVALVNRGGVICTGTLLRPNVVLTAAHCRGATVALSGARHDKRRGRAKVARFVAHPSRGVDLGLALLNTPLPGPNYPLVSQDVYDGPARFVGYGCEDDRSCAAIGTRKFFDVSLSALAVTCTWARASELGCSPTTEMVLPRGFGSDTCRGDSGGPLLISNRGYEPKDPESQRWAVLALTSRGLAHAERACGEGGVYVRLAPQRTWIEKQLARFNANETTVGGSVSPVQKDEVR